MDVQVEKMNVEDKTNNSMTVLSWYALGIYSDFFILSISLI